MAAKKFAHHFVPHRHPDVDEPSAAESSGRVIQHRAHALGHGALLGYVIIFFLTITGFYFIRSTAPQILGTAQYTAEQIIELTNIKRAEEGLAPLTTNTLLIQAAQAKANDMISNSYWAHFSPQGKSPWNFVTTAGYKYIYAGENLARDFNDPQSVINAWMVSPTHRSNLLDKNFKEIGVAVSSGNLTGREGVLVVQMFGSTLSQVPTEAETQGEVKETEPVPTAEIARLGTLDLQAQIAPTTASTSSGSATVLASRQFSISKMIGFALVGFVFILFVVEVAVASKKSHLSIKSSTLAHLGLLGLVLFALWYAVQGSVI